MTIISSLMIITIAVLLFIGNAGAAPIEEWNKNYGGDDSAKFNFGQQTSDGGYILVGTLETSHMDYALLIKTDVKGNEQWTRTFSLDSYSPTGISVQQTLDGGYIIAGISINSSFYFNTLLIKTDKNGNEQWNKIFNKGFNFPNSMQQTSDGGYIIAGEFAQSMKEIANNRINALLIKTDSNGNELWNKTFGGDSIEYPYSAAYSVQQTLDGGYILAGTTDNKAWIIKTDGNGNEQWNKLFGKSIASSVEQTLDGGYILAGWTSKNGDRDGWLIKVDLNGNKKWEQAFGGIKTDYINSVHQISDGGYILGGDTGSFGSGEFDAWLIKTDEYGNEQWSQYFGGTENDHINFVQETSDGGYLLGGETKSYGAGAWLIKVTEENNFESELDLTSPTEESKESATNLPGVIPPDIEKPDEKSIPGFGILEAIFLIVILLFRKSVA